MSNLMLQYPSLNAFQGCYRGHTEENPWAAFTTAAQLGSLCQKVCRTEALFTEGKHVVLMRCAVMHFQFQSYPRGRCFRD